MKKWILAISVAAALLAGPSCKKFLDTQPSSNTSTDNFYKTAADAELALNSCYNVLNEQTLQQTNLGTQGGLFYMQLQIMLTGSTDELTTRFNFTNADDTPWGLAAWNSTTVYNRQTWFYFFAGIERCNILLDKIAGIPDLTPARRKEIIGEARFLRGFYYMYMGMMWGGVPVNTTSDPDVQAPRNTLQEVFAQSLSDLQFAYDNLPARAAISGHANKWSAAGSLARSYAFVASAKQSNAGTDLSFPLNSFDWVDVNASYAKVRTISDDVINNGGFSLHSSYANLFHEQNRAGMDQESLFEVICTESPTSSSLINMQNLFIPQGNNALLGGGLVRLVPIGELYAKYNSADPRRTNNLTGALNSATSELVNGVKYYTPNAITATSIKNNGTFYAGKYRMVDPLSKKIKLNYWSGNYPVIRLAEIYLLRSEAIYALTNDATQARVDLNTVRARAVPAANLAAVSASYLKTDFVQELLDERTRELCFEGLRHFDLMRFNRYNSTIASLTTDRSLSFNNQSVAGMKQNWAPYRIWFPVPQSEIILNPNLIKNPGY